MLWMKETRNEMVKDVLNVLNRADIFALSTSSSPEECSVSMIFPVAMPDGNRSSSTRIT